MNPIHRYIALTVTVITILFLYTTPKPAQLHNAATHGQTVYSTAPSSRPPTLRFKNGRPKPPGQPYSKTIVMASLEKEDTAWIHQTHRVLNKHIYVLDTPQRSPSPSFDRYTVPVNRGGEAIAYLTYLIEQYGNLSDTTVFLRSLRYSEHDNNPVLNADAAETVALLNDAHVARVGYFNTRCHPDPGCSDGLHLNNASGGVGIDEDLQSTARKNAFTRDVWHELFPDVPEPGTVSGMTGTVSQPGGAQFALSRDRIMARPVEDYIQYRDWIMTSRLDDDAISGIFEYSWQAIFAGTHALCPKVLGCYCEGFGICFHDKEDLNGWMELLKRREILQDEVKGLVERSTEGDGKGGDSSEASFLRDRMGWCSDEMIKRRKVAWEKGNKWIGREITKNE